MAQRISEFFLSTIGPGAGFQPLVDYTCRSFQDHVEGGEDSGHIAGNGSQSIQELCLHPSFYKKQINMNLSIKHNIM